MTWHDGTVYKYAVLFHLPQDLNNPNSPDRDVVSMTVSGFNGQYNKTFAIPASGDIDGVENAYAQGDFSPVDSGDSFIPLNGYRFVGIKTDFIVGDVVPSCTVTLRDSSGLESTTDVSTTSTKLTEIYVDPASGNDSYTGSDLLPVATIGKAMEKLSGMTNTTIILVGNITVSDTLSFTASYPNITLKGGATPVTLTYKGTGRAITVSGGKLTLGGNITITGANDGAVEITGGEFVMETGSTLSGNEANSGGAVYVDGGSFTMSGGTISNNDAASGGGVSVRAGSFTMSGTDAKIQNNVASSDLIGGSGGGVYVVGGTFTMIDGTISDNTTSRIGAGGGIYVNGGNVSVSGGSIDTNIAGTAGGGVYVASGSVEIADSVTIQYNVVLDTEFKGIELYASAGNLTISGGVIQNDMYSMGIPSYAIYSEKTFAMTGSPTITDCAIALKQGARIDVQGLRTDAVLTNLQISPAAYTASEVLLEHATDIAICKKFGLYNPPADEIWWIGLENGNGVLKTIEGNYNKSTNTITVPTMPGSKDELQNTVNGSAESGVKVEITGGGTITVDSTVTVPGGADVAIKPGNGSTVTVDAPGDTTAFNVSGGELTLGGGGGEVNVSGDPRASSPTADGKEISLINISNGGTVTIAKNANIQNNKAGRGVTVTNGTLIMTGGSIKGNTGGFHYGSGVYVSGQNASFEMSGGEISDNTLELNTSGYRQGAGVMVCNGATFTLSNNGKITNNSGYEGAGVTVSGSTFIMNGGEISNNKGTGTSGGVYLVSSSIMNMNGGTIKNNSAKNVGVHSGGGGVYIGSSCNFTGSSDPNTTASITGNTVDNINVDVYFQTGGSGTYSPGKVTVGVGP